MSGAVGWRRYETVPLYSIEDAAETRHRFLKYTPEHMHCHATCFGPLAPPNSALLALSSLSSRARGWRVALTGVTLENDASFDVVKKLKLVGEPARVHKRTAFVRGLFGSQLEAARFEGAKLRTVAGVRGEIKKALSDRASRTLGAPLGTVRATFEDKLLMSDLVFVRTWVPVEPVRYYNPVESLLLRTGRAERALPAAHEREGRRGRSAARAPRASLLSLAG